MEFSLEKLGKIMDEAIDKGMNSLQKNEFYNKVAKMAQEGKEKAQEAMDVAKDAVEQKKYLHELKSETEALHESHIQGLIQLATKVIETPAEEFSFSRFREDMEEIKRLEKQIDENEALLLEEMGYKSCPNCEAEVPAFDKFCSQCGTHFNDVEEDVEETEATEVAE